MKKMLYPIILSTLLLPLSEAEAAKPKGPTNYVVFSVRGDCTQEDCIATLKESLQQEKSSIVTMDLASLAAHQTGEYKTVTITFRDLKTAPYSAVMQQIAAQGYEVVSYAIHDTGSGRDVIIPH